MMERIAYTFLLVLTFLFSYSQDPLASKVLTSEEMRIDFKFYRRLLQETHPGLYRYNTKEKMQAKLDSIYNVLDRPMPFYDFYKIIAALVSDIRCAHTNALPTKDFRKHLNEVKTLPFFLFPIQGKLYIIFNGSTDKQVTLGYELVRINGHRVDSITQVLKKHFWADGNAELSKNNVLQGGTFCSFYYTIIERPESFHLLFKDLSGKDYQTTVSAQFYSIAEKQYIKNPINKKAVVLYNKNNKSPWRLSFPKDIASAALLRFDAFGGKGMNTSEEAKLAMQKFMNSSLKQIERKKCKNLIVDVRSNPGGWDSQGIELFTYLMKQDTAVKYYHRLHAIADSSEFLIYSDLSEEDKRNVKKELKREQDGTFSGREEYSPDLKPQHPKQNRFKGQVYILMNERSYSSASEFLAVCKSNKVGIMVGEEAGGAYEGGNGASFIHVELPNSKIQVGTPLLYYDNAVKPVLQKGRGTMPDYVVPPQLEDILIGRDIQFEFVKDLIRKQ
jgi:Peptidase family S41